MSDQLEQREQDHDFYAAIEAQARPAVASEADDDYRDRHERAMRDHILGAGDKAHTCDDLCSDAILDRLAGKTPSHEYPLQPQYAVASEGLREALHDAGLWIIAHGKPAHDLPVGNRFVRYADIIRIIGQTEAALASAGSVGALDTHPVAAFHEDHLWVASDDCAVCGTTPDCHPAEQEATHEVLKTRSVVDGDSGSVSVPSADAVQVAQAAYDAERQGEQPKSLFEKHGLDSPL